MFKRLYNKLYEAKLILKFLKNGPKHVEELTKVLNARDTPFLAIGSFEYLSPFGLIRIQKDHYGPEVSIGWHHAMLDCNPNVYGLTREEALPLYNAILSNVPGMCDFEEKMLRLRKIQ